MDLRRLRHLVALADECHFGRAAERAHLSQPAFSRSIQALERAIGQRLFDRAGGEPRPTPAGQFLIERARRLLFDARCLQRDIELYGDARLGDTAFGAGPFPAVTLLPAVLPELRRRYPEVHLRIEVNNWVQLLERLRAEDIEFFVADMRSATVDPGLDIRPLGRQTGGLYVRAGHPLAGAPCAFVEAWGHGVAATRLPQPVKAALAALLGLPAGSELTLALECDDLALLRAVALGTDTVLATTDAAARGDLESAALVALRVRGLPPLYAEMGIVRLRGRSASPMALRAMELLDAAARDVNSFDGGRTATATGAAARDSG